ncbi:MAG: CHC2 zinc finger domain-containing protein [Candidatus Peregrinibacteria bacterium]|nr:CHC2 zinc finger domain-containing protein [Candidatus Peregrinibacteria bacterium]
MTINNLSEETIDYLQEFEEKWRKSRHRFSETELLDVFGDSIEEICIDKIKELKDLRNELILEIKRLGQEVDGCDDFKVMMRRECIIHFMIKPLQEIERKIYYFERLKAKKTVKLKAHKGQLKDADIERARNVPIVDVAETHLGQLRKTGKSYVTRCPFHQDNSPSFNLYTESNRFYCFGCNATGDVITFVQKLLNHDFKSAVLYLLNK